MTIVGKASLHETLKFLCQSVSDAGLDAQESFLISFSVPQDKRRRYGMLHSQESGSSVFFHSQEEGCATDGWGFGKDSESGFPSEKTPELLGADGDLGSETDMDPGQFPSSSSCETVTFDRMQPMNTYLTGLL